MVFDWTMLLILPGLILGLWAQSRVKKTYAEYSRVRTSRGMAAEDVVRDYLWHDFRADLSRWAGCTVSLYLVGDPGPADNTYGDGGGWADMCLEQ